MSRRLLLGALLAGVMLISLAVLGSRRGRVVAGPAPIHDAPALRGELIVSLFGDGGDADRPALHTTVLSQGAGYSGMQDNDLRGFLDGNFKYGWNQPGQTHVRVGRRDRAARYGEYELFRVLQRWDGIELPESSTVRRAALRIAVESGPESPVRVMLYEVKHDWNPGAGGIRRDHVSPPATGEVWWNDLAYGERPWNLPAVGYASDDPDGDTAAMPLAEYRYLPGSDAVHFESDALAQYVTRRVENGLPLLFLVKLADYHEDRPGSRLELWSAEHGDRANPVRRPRLTLDWESGRELRTVRRRVFLEYGRRWAMPRVDVSGASQAAVTLRPDGGSTPGTVERRLDSDVDSTKWGTPVGALELGASRWLDVRVLAARNPVYLGDAFTSELRDSWIRSAAPAEQVVPWVFVAPSGRRREIVATHLGDGGYGIEFRPDEIGPWTYSWSHRFDEATVRSAPGRFDVIGGDLHHVLTALDALEADLGRIEPERLRELRDGWMIRFMRLERAAMAAATPAEHRGDTGARLRQRLNGVRALLDEPAPETIPLVPAEPPDWQSDRPQRVR